MRTYLPFNILVLTMLAAARGFAGTTIYSWTGSQAIPDNNASGIAYSFLLNTPSPELISAVTVDLNIAGGWNGDLYGYLSHSSGFAVLLNRIGRTADDLDGSSASGLNVTFSDGSPNDIHTFNGDPVNGTFAPDGRFSNPNAVLDTDSRTAMLSSFNGLSANGFWTLYLADVSPLGVSTVQSWSVNITTAPIPEPSSFALLSMAVACALARRLRSRY